MHNIKVRHPKFTYDSMLKDESHLYFNDNAFATHFMNAMHIIVPIGERFFIRSVRALAGEIKDPELKQRVKAFYGQESSHDKEHVRFWDVLRSQGFDVDGFRAFFEKSAFEFLEPNLNRIFGPKLALSATVALEHYTALMASHALKPGCKTIEGMAPEMKDLMLWHAVEEIEHKSIAFDVLKEVDDSYFLRLIGFLIATMGLNGYAAIGIANFVSQDKEVTAGRFLQDLVKLPQMASTLAVDLAKDVWAYIKPGFHPDQKDDYYLAEDYLKQKQIA